MTTRIAFLVAIVANTTFAALAPDYLTEVKPLLASRCFDCHGGLKQQAKLRVDTAAAMLESEVVIPGRPQESEFFRRVSTTDLDERMPPEHEGSPFTAKELEILRAWIAAGAPALDDEEPQISPKDHWAFQRIERPALPLANLANPIDAFLAAKQAEHGLEPQPEADRRILLRRLYLDLIGLPPTAGQLASEEPFEDIVDQLLESPHYGERWGRHWMDVWRYSDWYGLGTEIRDSQKHLWRWRDWIVDSLNDNKGYHQMICEMLAGDEIAPNDPKTLAATGFLARSYYKFNRTTWLDNTIEHTGKAFMGLTANCAKCHDHKYDPITHFDYYQLRAIFEPYQVRVDAAPGELDLAMNGLTRAYDGNLGAATYLHERGDESKADKSKRISAGPPAFLATGWQSPQPVELPFEAWNPDLQEFVQGGLLARAKEKLTQAEADLKNLKLQLPTTDETQSNPAVGGSILADDFSKARPDLWQVVGQGWRYQDGHLSLTQSSFDKSWLRSKATHPLDFELDLKFRTTGGERYKSVGVRFDLDKSGKNSHWVYASVSGAKVHLAQTVEGRDKYFGALAKRPIKVNQEYTLNLKVRGRLINVALNGKFLFADNLPSRQPGAIQLVAYEATADFHSIEVRHLPVATVLEKAKTKPTAPAITASDVELAQAKLNLALAEYAFTQAHIDVVNDKGNAVETARRRQLDAGLAQARLDLLDVKKATKAAATVKKLEADLKNGMFPAYKPLTVSTVSLIKTPNKDALPAGEGYPKTSTGRRTALANWLTHRDHPLTARVAVNHIWMRHFGTPLVESVSDFGLRAPKPRHQDLLDYLAVELIESGWDMKRLHRLMLTSETWRRSSSNLGADPKTLTADGGNRYYWRMNSRRMEAQVVRDSLLHLAGTLDLSRGGPSVQPSPNVRRRSLYFFHSRDGRSKFLETFDDADVFACYRRSESVVPQQALAMMNSETTTMAARQIAAGFGQDLSPEAFAQAAFLKILARPAAESELAKSRAYLKEQPKREHFIHALLNHNDFLVIR